MRLIRIPEEAALLAGKSVRAIERDCERGRLPHVKTRQGRFTTELFVALASRDLRRRRNVDKV